MTSMSKILLTLTREEALLLYEIVAKAISADDFNTSELSDSLLDKVDAALEEACKQIREGTRSVKKP